MLKKLLLTLSVTAVSLLYANDLSLLGIQTNNTYNVTPILVKKLQSKSKTKAYQKTRNTLKELQQYKNKVNQELENVSNNLQLPVQVSTQETNVVNGSISWSLVNSKCELDPSAIFQKSMNDLVQKYKEIWNQLTNKNSNLWRLWLINRSIELYTKIKAIPKCYAKLMNPASPQYREKYTEYWALYNQCMANNLKGLIKYSNGSQAGTSNTVNTNLSVDVKTMAMQAYYAYICKDQAMSKTFGQAYQQCLQQEQEQMLSWINGKIDLGIKMDLANFKIAQQACILKRYNMQLDMQNLIMNGFKLTAQNNGAQSGVTITNTNAVVNNPVIQSRVSVEIATSMNDVINDSGNRNKVIYMVLQELRITNPYADSLDAQKIYRMYYYALENWLYDTFGMSNHIITLTVKENGIPIIDGKTFEDRWQLPVYFGYTRKMLFEGKENGNLQISQKAKELLKTPNIASTAEECLSVVTDPNVSQNPETFLLNDYAINQDAIMQTDDISALSKIEGKNFNPKAKNYKNRLLYYFYWYNYDTPAYNLVKKQLIPKFRNYNSTYMDIYVARKMLNSCIIWANAELSQVNKIQTAATKIYATDTDIGADGKPLSKKERELALDLKNAIISYMKQLKSFFTRIINQGNERINELNNYEKRYLNQLKEKTQNQNITIYYTTAD